MTNKNIEKFDKETKRSKFFTAYFLQTTHSLYLERNFSEKQVIQNTNPVTAGHALAAVVRDLSEKIFLESHKHMKILDIGGSLSRNHDIPTYNIVLSQKDMVRGLREEQNHRDTQNNWQEYLMLMHKFEAIEEPEELPPIDWSNYDEVLTHIEKQKAPIPTEEEQKRIDTLYHQCTHPKTIYRARHYKELKNQFDWLLFNHSAYDIPPQGIHTYMSHFGAKKATAFINKWSPGLKIYANTITCQYTYSLLTGEKLYGQVDEANTSYYAHKTDPRFYTTPGTYSLKGKTLSWETRVLRDDLYEIEFSLTRTIKNKIQESSAAIIKENYFETWYYDPILGKNSSYKTTFSPPQYFRNRIDTLLVRHFTNKIDLSVSEMDENYKQLPKATGKYPTNEEVFKVTQMLVATENRKILLTENNKSLSVNMSLYQMYDTTVIIASDFSTYLRISLDAARDHGFIYNWIRWILSFIISEGKINRINNWFTYWSNTDENITNTMFSNIYIKERITKIFNQDHSLPLEGTSFDLELMQNKFYDQFLGWASLDGSAIWGKLSWNSESRQHLYDRLSKVYATSGKVLNTTFELASDNVRKLKPPIIKLGDMTITLSHISTTYANYATYKLNKMIQKAIRDNRLQSANFYIETLFSETPNHEILSIQKPPTHFENVSTLQFSDMKIKNDCDFHRLGFSSTKIDAQDTLSFLKNLSARNDLINNFEDGLENSANMVWHHLGRVKFDWASPIEYYQRWINTQPTSKHVMLLKDFEEYKNSLTDANIFLKLEHLFKKYNEMQFVKAHTVTHFDQVCNCILTMFAEDFKSQLTLLCKNKNIIYTDGIPTFELTHKPPREDEFYFESDLTAQDAKQGPQTVLEFIKFYDLVGAPMEITTALFSTYGHTARNRTNGLKISNGIIKPTGGPDTGTNNFLNNLFISKDLLFSKQHVYSQILGDDLKSILKNTFNVEEYVAHANTFGTEMKPIVRIAPEFCSNVTYQWQDNCYLIPKTEKVLNSVRGSTTAYLQGSINATQYGSTLLNFATMYGFLQPCQTITQNLKENLEYNKATTPLFKNPEQLEPAMEALAQHSIYNNTSFYQSGLLGTLSSELIKGYNLLKDFSY